MTSARVRRTSSWAPAIVAAASSGDDGDLVDGQSQLADQRRQLLLHAVVDVPLDAPALLVLGLDDARPGRRDLGRLPLDLAQAGLELVGLAHGAQAQGGLAAERAEELAVVGVERAAALRVRTRAARAARRSP